MLKQLADKYIPAAAGRKVLKKKGETDDIIAEVISAFRDSRGQLNQFAPHLKAETLRQTLYNVWHFWKHNIRYQVDPEGVQWVQEPKALWARKVGDCKSLSVAVMCTLYELGIKASFRFTCYNPAIDFPTHVYVVVLNNGQEIPVDCVWKEFGTEKPFNKKWDYNMTSIYRLSGTDEVGRLSRRRKKALATEFLIPGSTVVRKVLKNSKPTDFLIPGSRIFRKLFSKKKKKRRMGDIRGVLFLPDNATHEVIGLLLDKQRLEMEQILSAKVHGIGSTYDRAYEMEITAHHNAVAELMGLPKRRCVGYGEAMHPHEMIEGISGKKGKQRKLNKAMKRNAAGKAVSKRQAKRLEKAGVAVNKRKEGLLKRVGKGLRKVVKAPARLAIRAKLPKAAPFFLYTFITDERVLNKLPEQVAIKRQKAMYYKDIIIRKLEMPAENFDKAVRNGIMNAFAKSPEEVLAKWMKDANFSIGVLPIVAAAFTALKGLLKLLVGNAAKNLQADIEQYSPQPEDWGTVDNATKQDMSETVRNQDSNTDPSYRTPQTEQEFFDSNEAELLYAKRGQNPGDASADSMLNQEKQLNEVVIRPRKDSSDITPAASEQEAIVPPGDEGGPKKDNSLLWVAGVAVAALLVGSAAGSARAKKKRA